jgi:hypothetical protein
MKNSSEQNLDVFLVMLGWPASAPKESFADAYVEELPE